MKNIKLFLPVCFLFVVMVMGFSIDVQKQNSKIPNDNADVICYVHPDGGIGIVAGATVTLRDSNGTTIGDVRTTNSSGYCSLNNHGSNFAPGNYTITAVKTGYSTGTLNTTLLCCNNSTRNVNMGPSE